MFPRNPFLLYNNLPGFSLLKALLFADETTLFASLFREHEMAFHPARPNVCFLTVQNIRLPMPTFSLVILNPYESAPGVTCQNLFTLLRIFSTNFLAAFPLKVLADLSSFYFYFGFGFFSDIKCYSISGKQFGLNLRNLRVDRGSDIPAIKLLGIYIIQYTLYCTQRPSTQLFLSHKTFK